jgi:hypothetical protein
MNPVSHETDFSCSLFLLTYVANHAVNIYFFIITIKSVNEYFLPTFSIEEGGEGIEIANM